MVVNQILRHVFVVGLGLGDVAYVHVRGGSAAYEVTPRKALYGYFERDRSRRIWAIASHLYVVDWNRVLTISSVGQRTPVWFTTPPLAVMAVSREYPAGRRITLPIANDKIPAKVMTRFHIRSVFTSLLEQFGPGLAHVRSMVVDDMRLYHERVDMAEGSLQSLKIMLFDVDNLSTFEGNIMALFKGRALGVTELRFVVSGLVPQKSWRNVVRGFWDILLRITGDPCVASAAVLRRVKVLEVPVMSQGMLECLTVGRQRGLNNLRQLEVDVWVIESLGQEEKVDLHVTKFTSPRWFMRTNLNDLENLPPPWGTNKRLSNVRGQSITFQFRRGVSVALIRDSKESRLMDRPRYVVSYVFDKVGLLEVICGMYHTTFISASEIRRLGIGGWKTTSTNIIGLGDVELSVLQLLPVDRKVDHTDLLGVLFGTSVEIAVPHIVIDATYGLWGRHQAIANVGVKGLLNDYVYGVKRITVLQTTANDIQLPASVTRLDLVGLRVYPLDFLLSAGSEKVTELHLENASLNMTMPLPGRQELDLREFPRLTTIHYDYALPLFSTVELLVKIPNPADVTVVTHFVRKDVMATGGMPGRIILFTHKEQLHGQGRELTQIEFITPDMQRDYERIRNTPDGRAVRKIVMSAVFQQIPWQFRNMVSVTPATFERLRANCLRWGDDHPLTKEYNKIVNLDGGLNAIYYAFAWILFGPTREVKPVYRRYTTGTFARRGEFAFAVLNGRYSVELAQDEMSHGTYGSVRAGVDMYTWDPVVVKQPRRGGDMEEGQLMEYNMMKVVSEALRCPKVISPLAVCAYVKHYNADIYLRQSERVWIVMERGLGPLWSYSYNWVISLKDSMDKLPEVLKFNLKSVIDISEALSCMHGNGLIHSDVKAGNVIFMGREKSTAIGYVGQAQLLFKLTDFGLSFLHDRSANSVLSTRLQNTSIRRRMLGRGTFAYPYKLIGNPVRLDIYALGVTMVRALFTMNGAFGRRGDLKNVNWESVYIQKITDVSKTDIVVRNIIERPFMGVETPTPSEWFYRHIDFAKGRPAWLAARGKETVLSEEDGIYMLRKVWKPAVEEFLRQIVEVQPGDSDYLKQTRGIADNYYELACDCITTNITAGEIKQRAIQLQLGIDMMQFISQL